MRAFLDGIVGSLVLAACLTIFGYWLLFGPV